MDKILLIQIIVENNEFTCIDLCRLCMLNKEANILFSKDHFWKRLTLFNLPNKENIKEQYKTIFEESYISTYTKREYIRQNLVNTNIHEIKTLESLCNSFDKLLKW